MKKITHIFILSIIIFVLISCKSNFYSIKFIENEAVSYSYDKSIYPNDKISEGGNFKFSLKEDKGETLTDNLMVYNNTTLLVESSGIYEIKNVKSDILISVKNIRLLKYYKVSFVNTNDIYFVDENNQRLTSLIVPENSPELFVALKGENSDNYSITTTSDTFSKNNIYTITNDITFNIKEKEYNITFDKETNTLIDNEAISISTSSTLASSSSNTKLEIKKLDHAYSYEDTIVTAKNATLIKEDDNTYLITKVTGEILINVTGIKAGILINCNNEFSNLISLYIDGMNTKDAVFLPSNKILNFKSTDENKLFQIKYSINNLTRVYTTNTETNENYINLKKDTNIKIISVKPINRLYLKEIPGITYLTLNGEEITDYISSVDNIPVSFKVQIEEPYTLPKSINITSGTYIEDKDSQTYSVSQFSDLSVFSPEGVYLTHKFSEDISDLTTNIQLYIDEKPLADFYEEGLHTLSIKTINNTDQYYISFNIDGQNETLNSNSYLEFNLMYNLSIETTEILNLTTGVNVYIPNEFSDSITSNGTSKTVTALNSNGNPKVLVIPISFGDEYHSVDTLSRIETAFNGTEESTGWQSVSSFYSISSYNNVSIDFTVLDKWYTLSHSTSYYNNDSYGSDTILREATKALDSSIDYNDFDTDLDGYADGIWLVYDHPVDFTGESNLFWAYVTHSQSRTFQLDGIMLDYYGFAGTDFMDEPTRSNEYLTVNSITFCHETGHMFGLDDYYDYYRGSYTENYIPIGGTYGAGMMDYNVGDMNPFSKLLLNWVDPMVITKTTTVEIKNFEENGQFLLVSKDIPGSIYGEYYYISLYTNTGLNLLDEPIKSVGSKNYGILVLYGLSQKGLNDTSDGYPTSGFLYDNSGLDAPKELTMLTNDGIRESSYISNPPKITDLYSENENCPDFYETWSKEMSSNNGKLLFKSDKPFFNFKVLESSVESATIEITFLN